MTTAPIIVAIIFSIFVTLIIIIFHESKKYQVQKVNINEDTGIKTESEYLDASLYQIRKYMKLEKTYQIDIEWLVKNRRVFYYEINNVVKILICDKLITTFPLHVGKQIVIMRHDNPFLREIRTMDRTNERMLVGLVIDRTDCEYISYQDALNGWYVNYSIELIRKKENDEQ